MAETEPTAGYGSVGRFKQGVRKGLELDSRNVYMETNEQPERDDGISLSAVSVSVSHVTSFLNISTARSKKHSCSLDPALE